MAYNEKYLGDPHEGMFPNHTDEEVEKKIDEENFPKRAISLMWNQRSVDTPLGLPFNIASYGLLLEIFAKEVNMIPDDLIGNLGDTHIYLDQLDGVKEQCSREVLHKLPKIEFKDHLEDFNTLIGDLDNFVLRPKDIILFDYESQDKIYFPLSN